MRKTLASAAALAAVLTALPASAATTLAAGDLMFTSFNADEDGLSFVTLVNLTAGTTVYFGDNEWTGSAFNTGESYNQWVSPTSTVAAGTVIRLLAYDKTTLSASIGTLSRVTVSGSANWGIANSGEAIYAYQGSSATAPTSFITAVTNGTFAADGPLTGTGLTEGVNAVRLNTLFPSATPDYGVYSGVRGGQASFAAYRPLLASASNWTVDTTDGAYATTLPDMTPFSIVAVPEAGTPLMLLAGLAAIGSLVRRRAGR